MKNKNLVFSIIALVGIIILLIIPTGFEKQIYKNSYSAKGKVLNINESSIYNTGMIKQGNQVCEIKILNGKHKGKVVWANNLLSGKLEADKLFKVNEKALVLVEMDSKGEITGANVVEHYRLGKIVILVLVFFLLLGLLGGVTGIRTILSFIFTIVTIWKILIPLLLKGYSPMLVGIAIGSVISLVTLILVSGFTKRTYAAILGALISSILTCVLGSLATSIFNIDGVIMQWSESLLYAGFESLDLTGIYKASIYLSCSGAILDLAIDISAAIEELYINNKEISKKDILKSGMNISRSVLGTQTTTLLLAYLGSFICVMMVYMAQGTPFINILNSQFISSEIVHTFIGCIGLVIVCPITTIICGKIYTDGSNFKNIVKKSIVYNSFWKI
ncbi:YibE/F family protein [uncultured Clostridium sp.]|uniref:YibE/F family protein n=1 Tax=uncultured Clostridium sp. TaxID=59620 RepID=UPI002618E19B|nr:YibE/F family protein [uncultured Clostridium sp.]